jgi:ADP-ribose pyrophosphatase YjhB (NUDIX family)
MPAGALELDESIYDCLVREVKEETGLEVLKATLIVIYSSPAKQSFVDRYGNEHQVIEYLFRVDEWAGMLVRDTDESVDAAFFPLEELPEASNEMFSKHHEEVFHDYRRFDGAVMLK